MALNLITLASEAAAEEGGISPWIVGVGIFAALVAMLLALVSFGGGRDHS